MNIKNNVCLLLGLLLMTPTLTYGANLSTPAELNQEATLLDVTVPVSFPISVDNKGGITTADNVSIVNNSYGPIAIEKVSVTPKGNWSISDFDKDYSTSVVGSKEFGFKIDNKEVSTDGSTSISNKIVNGGSSIDISYDSTVAPQKEKHIK